jgi:hypothetical protein
MSYKTVVFEKKYRTFYCFLILRIIYLFIFTYVNIRIYRIITENI